MKKRYFIFLLVLISFNSCVRLDDQLFNNSEKITEYKRENYPGKPDFILPSTYTIPEANIHVFTLNSKAPGEEQSETIYATYIGDINQIAQDTVIMYCHGNKWHMDFYWQRAKLLANVGGKLRFGVLMIDYRGYGLSSGKPSEKGLYADVDAALNWLKSSGLSNDRLVIYGFSMGTAPATKLTAEPRSMIPSKLMLEAPFASAEVMVQDAVVLSVPGTVVTNLSIANAEEIKSVNQPFCWLHGTKDDFLSIKTHGEVVFGNYKGTYKEGHRVSGATHTNVPEVMGFTEYCKVLENFITKK